MAAEPLLPVHGFVLAGGKSSRMGSDKALLPFRGSTLVETALGKVRAVCATVGIAGSRDDLQSLAPIARDLRPDAGPGAGLEAGLACAQQDWVMFLPVDVPLVPEALLRRWATAVLQRAAEGVTVSQLVGDGRPQPAFCLLRRDRLAPVSAALDAGERRISRLLALAETHEGCRWAADADLLMRGLLAPGAQRRDWFLNVNTPAEWAVAEAGTPAEETL